MTSAAITTHTRPYRMEAALKRPARPRPQAKRPAKPRASDDARADAFRRELARTAPGREFAASIERERNLYAATILQQSGVRARLDDLANLRESWQRAYHARDGATTAAEQLRHQRELESLGLRVREAERDLRQARAEMAETERQRAGAAASAEMAARELVGM